MDYYHAHDAIRELIDNAKTHEVEALLRDAYDLVTRAEEAE